MAEICYNNSFITAISVLKTLIEDFSGITDIYYENIPKSKNEVYPIIDYNMINSQLVNEQRRSYNFEINIWDNKYENILDLEMLRQNIQNGFTYFNRILTHNNEKFIFRTLEVNSFNLPTETDDLRRRQVDIFFEIEMKIKN